VRRFWACAALLALTAAYVLSHPPVNLAIGRGVLARVPGSFGEWNGTELSFEDAVVEDLQSDDLLIRRYARGDDRVWLCIVFHQNRRYGAHDARICYESQGYSVGPERPVRLEDGSPQGLTVNRFIADHPSRRRLVYYWWSTRGLSTADAQAFRGRMAVLGALDNRSWGAFVRIETPYREGDEANAEADLREFGNRVARGLPLVLEPPPQGRGGGS
jgi:EpsI family protein